MHNQLFHSSVIFVDYQGYDTLSNESNLVMGERVVYRADWKLWRNFEDSFKKIFHNPI